MAAKLDVHMTGGRVLVLWWTTDWWSMVTCPICRVTQKTERHRFCQVSSWQGTWVKSLAWTMLATSWGSLRMRCMKKLLPGNRFGSDCRIHRTTRLLLCCNHPVILVLILKLAINDYWQLYRCLWNRALMSLFESGCLSWLTECICNELVKEWGWEFVLKSTRMLLELCIQNSFDDRRRSCRETCYVWALMKNKFARFDIP